MEETLRPACVAIDLGTCGTRAFLRSLDGSYQRKVPNPAHGPAESRSVLSRYEYPSTVFIYDEENSRPLYIPGRPDGLREGVSAKLLFYLLADADDELMAEYPLIEPITRRVEEDPNIIDRARSAVVELLKTVAKSAKDICYADLLDLCSVGLTIPAQWVGTRFQLVYRELAAEAFGFSQGKIFFITETEALAHYLLTNSPRDLHFPKQVRSIIALFMDFGGHNMNGALFNVVQVDNNEVGFSGVQDPFGIGGGSELWLHEALHACIQKVTEVRGSLSVSDLNDITRDFNDYKEVLGPRSSEPIPFRVRLNNQSFFAGCARLEAEEVDYLFDKAHAGPLQLARSKIEELSELRNKVLRDKLNDVDFRVIISGGTTRHPAIQNRIRAYCDEFGLCHPIFIVQSASLTSEYSAIAAGCANAIAKSMTLETFLERGAAFGLQVKQADEDDNNPEGDWDEYGRVLLSKSKMRRTIKLEDGDEVKLIASPAYHHVVQRQPGRKGGRARARSYYSKPDMPYHLCYDTGFMLGELGSGTWNFTASTVSHPRTGATISIEARRKGNGRAGRRLTWMLGSTYQKGSQNIVLYEKRQRVEQPVSTGGKVPRIGLSPRRRSCRASKRVE